MKKNLLITFFTLLTLCASAQNSFTTKLTPIADADIGNRSDAINKNFGDLQRINPIAWTWDADGLGQGVYKSLIKFDLTTLPDGATIKSAKLKLFADTLGFEGGHSQLSGSNAAWLKKVTSSWEESTVTWNNQPTTTQNGQVAVPASTSKKQNYTIDVTSLVTQMYFDPSSNFGFMLNLQNETPYRQLLFGSKENTNETLRPYLEVTYEACTTGAKLNIPVTSDADVFSRTDSQDKNLGDLDKINPIAWTWDADGLGSGVERSFLYVDLSSLPQDAVIESASLMLFADTVSFENGHSVLSGSNAAYLSLVTSPWEESTVTWNTQPTFSTANQVTLAQSSSRKQDYSIDVKNMVVGLLANPASNYGFSLRLQNESPYRQLVFGSRENTDVSIRPYLSVVYSTCTITSINNIKETSNRINAFPNPFNDQVKVSLASGSEGAKVSLLDINGQVVLESVSSEAEVTFDLSGFPSGIYFVKVHGDSQPETLKLIKK